MQDKVKRLRVLADALALLKEAYMQTKDSAMAAAALVLCDMALAEIAAIEQKEKAGGGDVG